MAITYTDFFKWISIISPNIAESLYYWQIQTRHPEPEEQRKGPRISAHCGAEPDLNQTQKNGLKKFIPIIERTAKLRRDAIDMAQDLGLIRMNRLALKSNFQKNLPAKWNRLKRK